MTLRSLHYLSTFSDFNDYHDIDSVLFLIFQCHKNKNNIMQYKSYYPLISYHM